MGRRSFWYCCVCHAATGTHQSKHFVTRSKRSHSKTEMTGRSSMRASTSPGHQREKAEKPSSSLRYTARGMSEGKHLIDLSNCLQNVWHSLAMLVCECHASEVVHDATCDGTTAHMILQCPMCEESILLELQVTSLRRWSEHEGDWLDKEATEIN